MKMDFLRADDALTKSFTRKESGEYQKTPYPNAFRVTSLSHEIEDLKVFYETLEAHAAHGHCLLKGNLDRKLENESRRGRVPTSVSTEWVVFDVDGLDDVTDAEEFVTEVLPTEFHHVSYIVQHSASSKISDDGLRIHIFFLIETRVAPDALKRWLKELNLTSDLLSQQLELSRNGMTLKYPLDISVADNAKLIFIAPPVCTNFPDPLEDRRIDLVEKSRDRVDFSFSSAPKKSVEALVRKKIDELRQKANLKKRKAKYKTKGDFEVLLNPDPAAVTDHEEQNGFVRVNLNGGDSWAYWYRPDDPTYLHNFKGEPSVPLQMLDKKHWQEVVVARRKKCGPMLLVFRDKKTDTFYAGEIDQTDDRILELNKINKHNITGFYENHGENPPDPIPDVDYEFRPQDDRLADVDNSFVNAWEPTEYQRRATEAPEVPPVTNKILWSVVGANQKVYDRFLNWLAFIYQTRQKTGVAYVLHGVEGTGKGLLFNYVLRPIFGEEYCITKLLRSVKDQFNGYLKTSLLVNYDEARLTDAGFDTNEIRAAVKDWITEPTIDIREMRQTAKNVANYTNFIFCSNERDVIPIEETDRRFAVAPRQEHPLDISEEEVATIQSELQQFASFLKSYKVDEKLARTALDNEAKRQMRDESMNAVDQLVTAVAEGNLAYFIEALEDAPSVSSRAWTYYMAFKKAVLRWLHYAKKDEPCPTATVEIKAAYEYLIGGGNRSTGIKKFARLLQHRNLKKTKDIRIPNEDGSSRTVKGRDIFWRLSPRDWATYKDLLDEKRPDRFGETDNVVGTPERLRKHLEKEGLITPQAG